MVMASRRKGSPSSWLSTTSIKVVSFLFMSIHGVDKRLLKFLLGRDLYALHVAGLGHFRVLDPVVELGAHKVVSVPERGVALLRTPLVVAPDDHGDWRPVIAAAS